MEILISIGERLREVREAMGMTQSEFAAIAEKAGVKGTTRQSQANYEKGKQALGVAYLAAIAAAGADVAYILTGQRATSPARAPALTADGDYDDTPAGPTELPLRHAQAVYAAVPQRERRDRLLDVAIAAAEDVLEEFHATPAPYQCFDLGKNFLALAEAALDEGLGDEQLDARVRRQLSDALSSLGYRRRR